MKLTPNADGTYNLINVLAAVSGLSEDEVRWTAHRLRELTQDEGKSKDEAKRIVAEEVKTRPWAIKE